MERYQPYPFIDIKVEHICKDCEERYQAIKADFGDVSGKHMVDFFSANCYFGFRFLQDGGASVTAVEIDKEVSDEVNSIAIAKGLNLACVSNSNIITRTFDIGLLLDSFGYGGTDEYIAIMQERCKVAYISAPHKTTVPMLQKLWGKFGDVQPVFEGKEGRIIYRCSL